MTPNNWIKGYSAGQLLFFHDMILLIKHKLHWELIRQKSRRKLIKIIAAKKIKGLTKTTR